MVKICGNALYAEGTMPENPNIDPDDDGFYGSSITMATTANTGGTRSRAGGQGAPRVSSAGLQYYDIATQLLGKKGSDLEELFIAAARVRPHSNFGPHTMSAWHR